MRTIYECEVCGGRFKTAEDALACEARPVYDPAPVGLIISRRYPKDPPFSALCNGELTHSGHYFSHYTWWFRGNGCGDDEQPRTDIVRDDFTQNKDTDIDCASFHRAVAKARAMGWEPKVLRGGQVVPLSSVVPA